MKTQVLVASLLAVLALPQGAAAQKDGASAADLVAPLPETEEEYERDDSDSDQETNDGSELCGATDAETFARLADFFVGDWRINHQAGIWSAGGITQPLPADTDTDMVPVSLGSSPGTLMMRGPDGRSMELAPTDEPNWTFRGSEGIPAPTLTDEDISAMAGCEISDLPRLIGQTEANMGGVTMDFTYRLIMTRIETMYGIMHFRGTHEGMPVDIWRTVTMER